MGSPAEPGTIRVPLSTIARQWTRLGCIGFGGPPAHIALLRKLCVEQRGWLSADEFEDGVATTNLLPGPASTQLTIFCAWRLAGPVGAIVGGACFIVPGLIVILSLSVLFLAAHPPLWVEGAAAGAGAAVPAVAAQAALSLAPASWRRATARSTSGQPSSSLPTVAQPPGAHSATGQPSGAHQTGQPSGAHQSGQSSGAHQTGQSSGAHQTGQSSGAHPTAGQPSGSHLTTGQPSGAQAVSGQHSTSRPTAASPEPAPSPEPAQPPLPPPTPPAPPRSLAARFGWPASAARFGWPASAARFGWPASAARWPAIRWLAFLVVGAVTGSLAGPYLVLVLALCGFIELLVRTRPPRPANPTSHANKRLPLIAALAVPLTAGTLLSVAWEAFKVGALSYGGGFVIIPLMQHDVVRTYHWMTGSQFLSAVALGQVTPGPVVQTVSVVGYAAAGLGGGLLASFVAFLPSFVFVLAGASKFAALRRNTRVQAFLTGAGPAAIGAIAGSTIPLARDLTHLWQAALLALAAIWLIAFRKNLVIAIIASACLGIIAVLAGAPVG